MRVEHRQVQSRVLVGIGVVRRRQWFASDLAIETLAASLPGSPDRRRELELAASWAEMLTLAEEIDGWNLVTRSECE